MLSIKGTFQDGVIKLDEPVEAREGQSVIITFLDDSSDTIPHSAWDDLAQLVKCNQVKTGVGDLAHQHDLADAFSAPSSRKQAIAFINDLWQSPAMRVVPLSRTLLEEGWALYSQRFDKGWGLTDCTSFVVMTQEKITQAFTSDRHFEQAGFTKLL